MRIFRMTLTAVLVVIAVGITRANSKAAELSFSYLDGAQVLTNSGELRLGSNPDDLILAFKPTEWKIVTSMAVYRDKLFMGACEQVSVHDSGDVIVYDEDAGSVSKIYSVQEQGLAIMYVSGDKLYVPGTDSTTDGNTGNMYMFDGKSWEKKSTITGRNVAHLWDMGMMNGKLYVSTNNRERDAMLWESADDGDTWKVVYEYHLQAGTAIYLENIAVFRNKLYTWIKHNYHGAIDIGLVEYDGEKAREISPFGEDIRVSVNSFGNIEDRLYVCGEFGPFYVPPAEKALLLSVSPQWRKRRIGKTPPVSGCCAFDGESCEQVPFFKGKTVRAFGMFKGSFVAAYSSENGNSSVAISEGGEWKEIASIPAGNFGESIAEYRGRLFVGTEGNGNVYVSSYNRTGSAISEPVKVGSGESVRLAVDAIVPEKTSIEIQIRKADTPELLNNNTFVGYNPLDNRTLEYKNNSGKTNWVQWKIVMKTDDPLQSPRVRSIKILN